MPALLLATALLAAHASAAGEVPVPAGEASAAAGAADSTASASVAPDTTAAAAPVLRFATVAAFGSDGEARERLVEPAGMTTDAFGRVYVTDAATHRLARWDAAGRRLDEAGSLGSGANEFRRPGAVARLGSLGVAVLDVENRRIVTFDLQLHLVGVLAELGTAELESLLGPVTPVALAADRGGAVYVADADGDRVLAFDFSGRYLRAIGGHGETEGRFRGLAAIAAAPHGELVAGDRPRERGPVRLQWFDAGGRVIRVAYTAQQAPHAPGVRRPGAIALAVDDSGRVAVSDEASGTIELLGPSGATLGRFGGLARPGALAFAPDGTLLVAESGAGRVRRLGLVPAATGE